MAFDVRGVAALLGVYDMPRSVRFYRDVLGCTVVNTSPVLGEDYFHWALLQLGQAQFMLNTNFESNQERPLQPESARNAAHRDVCLYFDCPDVDAAYRDLRGKGLEIKEPVDTYYHMRQLYLADPDGYCLCFQSSANT